VTEQKKKAEEDKVMIEDKKRILTNRLEENTSEVQRIASMQLETMNQVTIANHELNGKDIVITTLKLQNEQLSNDLRRENEFAKSFNKPSEALKYFEKLMRSPRPNDDTTGLGYTNTEEGESSKSGEERSDKGKNSKPTCHNCGKLGHTANVCRSKTANQNPKQKFMGHCHKCNKQGHQAHECRTKTMSTQRFEGYCYNYQKYRHREYECRSKPKWSSNKQTKVNHNGNSYNWDYNTRYSCHYCQEYGHVPENCIRMHFRSDYSRWLS
jgi:DNA-directed RNA polymerase subunit F